MNQEEIEKLAFEIYKLQNANKEAHGNFHVPEELHYVEHSELRDLLKDYKTAKSMFWKAFLGLVILGAIVLAGIGILSGSRA